MNVYSFPALVYFGDASDPLVRRWLSWPSHCEVYVGSPTGVWSALSMTSAGLVVVPDVDVQGTVRDAERDGRRIELWWGEVHRPLTLRDRAWLWQMPVTCVTVVRSVIGCRRWALTPGQLRRVLPSNGFSRVCRTEPGGHDVGKPPKPKVPAVVESPEPADNAAERIGARNALEEALLRRSALDDVKTNPTGRLLRRAPIQRSALV